MSDLAPFVAATIRDKVVMDQQEEIETLRAERDQAKHCEEQLKESLITITSPDGNEVYAEALLAKRIVESDGQGGITHFTRLANKNGLRATNPNLENCQVRDIENAVIRVGGVQICRIGDYTEREEVIMDEDEGYVRLVYDFTLEESRPIRYLGRFVSLDVDYGPIPEENRTADIDLNPNAHENQVIRDVYFRNLEFNTTEG